MTGYFWEGRGYQENLWAEYLSLAGFQVCVFTSNSHNLIFQNSEVSQGKRFEVTRLTTWRMPFGILLSSKLSRALDRFQPELVFWIGVGQFFGLPLILHRKFRHLPVVSFFGENLGMHEFDWRKSGISFKQRIKAVGFRLMRGGYYRHVFRRSNIIVATKQQTSEILLSLCSSVRERSDCREKLVELPLGYDPRLFRVDAHARRAVRDTYGLKEQDLLIVVSSRFSKGKRLDRLVKFLSSAFDDNKRLKVVLIGFVANDPVSESIRRQIDASIYKDRFITQPFLPREDLSRWFNAADIGLYHNPSISVQEAMGTGLYMCLSNDGSMSHLISSAEYGLFFDRNDQASLIRCIRDAAQTVSIHMDNGYHAWRLAASLNHAWLGYDRLTWDLMERLKNTDAYCRYCL
ncbi:putative glycosyl transferase, family I [Desulfosarcina variabilis str. Montpellier]